MANEMPEQIGTAATGALVNAVYAERSVTYYAVSEHELSSLTLVNTAIAIAVGVGTFFLGIAGPIWISIVEKLVEPEATRGLMPGMSAPVLLTVLAVVAFIVAAVLLAFRQGETTRIRAESKMTATQAGR